MNAASATGILQRRRRQLVTPEGIGFNLTVAGRGARLGALVIDLVIIGVLQFATVLILIAIAGGVANFDQMSGRKDAIGQALQFLIIIYFAAMFLFRNGYFLFFELGPRGATPGKRMMGMRIASRDGGRLTAEMVLARNLLRDIELFLPVTFLLVAKGGDMGASGFAAAAWFLIFALFPCFNRDSLRAGDLIAGTWVVEAPKTKLAEAMSVGHTAQGGASHATGAAYRFGEKELAAYGEYELQTLERVLREGRKEALIAVHEAVCRKIGWNPGAGDEHAFLEAYYTQLRARLEGGMRLGVRKADKWAGGEESWGKGSAYRFGPKELDHYGEDQVRTLERVLRENDPAALSKVQAAICRKIGWDPGAGDERGFLEAYYAQLRDRLKSGGARPAVRKVDG